MNNSTAQADSSSAPVRDGFLVLGMHRSGTSSVAGTLAKLGAAPPKTLLTGNPDNLKGHWESVKLISLHDELLANAGGKWNDWRQFNPEWKDSPVAAQFKTRAKALLRSEFDGHADFVLKDPRICRFPQFWLEILREENIMPRIVVPVRVPLEVAKSLKTRDGFSLNEGLLLWLRHTLDAEAKTRDVPRTIILWDSFLKDWRTEIERIAKDLNIRWPRLTDFTAAEIDAFLTGELKHERAPVDAARVHPDMHEWVMAVYDALVELSRNPSSNSARATLDDVKAVFDKASRLFGRTLAEMELDRKTLVDERTALAADRDARVTELQRTIQALECERARSAELQHAHDVTSQERQASAQELQQTLQMLAEERTRLPEQQQSYEEAVANLRLELDAARLAAKEREGLIEQQQLFDETIATLRREIETQRDALLVEQQNGAGAREVAQQLQEDRDRLAELHRQHDETLATLRLQLKAERDKLNTEIQHHEQELHRNELSLRSLKVAHSELLNDLNAKNKILNDQLETCSAELQESLKSFEAISTDNHRLSEEFERSSSYMNERLQKAEQDKMEAQEAHAKLVAKIHRARQHPFRSYYRWVLGRGI